MIRVRTALVLRLGEEAQAPVEVGERDRDVRGPERGGDLEAGGEEPLEGIHQQFLEPFE
jgi:hypothetical protein